MSVSGATNACSKSTVSHVVGSNGCEKLVQPRLRPMCISIDHSDVDYVGPRQPASRERSEESSERIAFSTPEDILESEPPSPTNGPTPNLGEVAPGIYRSSFPRIGNFEHLRSFGLKTILTLVAGEYPEENERFMEENGIQHFQVPIPAHKDPSVIIPLPSIAKSLSIISNRRNHPILIHCNKGKHRTGCIVACYRKMCDWTVPDVIAEYRKYAGNKARSLDEKFIDGFDETSIIDGIASVPIISGLPTPPASLKDDLKDDEDSTPTRMRSIDSKMSDVSSV